jgi:hypothetical protein
MKIFNWIKNQYKEFIKARKEVKRLKIKYKELNLELEKLHEQRVKLYLIKIGYHGEIMSKIYHAFQKKFNPPRPPEAFIMKIKNNWIKKKWTNFITAKIEIEMWTHQCKHVEWLVEWRNNEIKNTLEVFKNNDKEILKIISQETSLEWQRLLESIDTKVLR